MKNKGILLIWSLPLIIMLGACGQTGGTDMPFAPPTLPNKISLNEGKVKVLCYIDTAQYSPLNVRDYTMEGSPYFDYVVLGAAQVKKDAKGVYLFLPEPLKKVLDRRTTLLVPLQKQGIKVLLGITGGGDPITFGAMSKDDIEVNFPHTILQYLKNYRLDGIEFYDSGAAPSVYPFTITNPDEQSAAWVRGGDYTNNVLYFTRKLIGEADQVPIILREEHFGRYLPVNVSGSAGEATFSGTAQQINYFINPYFGTFVDDSVQNLSKPYFIYRPQYGPFSVNFSGEQPVPPVTDPQGNQDIRSFSARFAEKNDDRGGCYGILYYYNLKPVSQSQINQGEYLSITSQIVFGQTVICSGGNYLKDW